MASFMADYLRKYNKMSITAIRKLMTSIGVFGPAITLIVTTFVGCNSLIIIVLLCIAMTFSGFGLSGYNVTHMDMCPDFAGTLFGITNSIANIAGALGPLSVGIYTAEGATLANWSKVFYTTAAVYITTGSIFVIFASAEIQPWAIVNDESKIEKQPVKKPMEINIKSLQTKL
ncbi:sialin-like [Parasteatoda tepidariorum]|uniref:sialin-like n=1 Tax=Parasteatoda tepidariorum TaxID=114398 RepID=UPI001C72765E|nr:sialin-like [Parasteatoda tepidariorum]